MHLDALLLPASLTNFLDACLEGERQGGAHVVTVEDEQVTNDNRSDDLFPIDQEEEDGQPMGCTLKQLLDAIVIWFHAQNTANPVTVGMAAAAFNVSPNLIWDGFNNRCDPFFWIEDEDKPLEQCRFEIDGY
ncbi:hypothetical protein [Leisingera sp. M658]|uniref:hypothetical protein n=1 Tax=Leisingera sp. M658 TaxID=2867015 RepID=UPI0021A28A4B|nr:hypothetical protein [Leisingera sp. M658]UWQ77382.1 hypothetical protein K3724_22620 [Leisingera sp. M658]